MEAFTRATPLNATNGTYEIEFSSIIYAFIYSLICVLGTIGNGLVIIVIIRYAKMKTVTNTYLLNLAISDLCFLVGLPFLTVTILVRHWIFGSSMCKIFMMCTSTNSFTSAFTLTVMSFDRWLAVCHPVRSISYRTPLVAKFVSVGVWGLSMLVMIPVFLYSTTVTNNPGNQKESCKLIWPKNQAIIHPDKAFIWYGLLLGFAIPTALISVFYMLVVIRLKSVGPKNRKNSDNRKRTHTRVTKLVLTVIAVYVICWLPHWIYQIYFTFAKDKPPDWVINLYQAITILSYTNSTLNPVLYALMSDNFRKSFSKAFRCISKTEVEGTLNVEPSIFPRRKKSRPQNRLTLELAKQKSTSNLELHEEAVVEAFLNEKMNDQEENNKNVCSVQESPEGRLACQV
ncbi:unnamed protein product [Dimorphilus gyrociliatus]|uniref:G-protein coupled receptors family 1 profile domain-containing protein n=1 Tax=Dimorphilus gyrociliatus TaxID=2664684 RepID=A0A7I8VQ28_9ANNE|nr:unnamed protein product [Dimorphilus gyrociliatus]